MDRQEKADYSEAEDFGSEADSMEGSYEGRDNLPEQIKEAMEAFPGRRSGRAQIEAVGFGYSKYGINPQDIRVANSGPSADNDFVYRLDELPLYRWDSRGPEIIFSEGFRNKNNQVPTSLQFYRTTTETRRWSVSPATEIRRLPNPTGLTTVQRIGTARRRSGADSTSWPLSPKSPLAISRKLPSGRGCDQNSSEASTRSANPTRTTRTVG